MNTDVTDKRALLRHTVATLAYRGGKAVANAPEGFDQFRLNESTRTPGQILAHIGDLLDWGLSIASGKQKWHDSKPLAWNDEVARFHAALAAFDDYLGSDQPVHAPEAQAHDEDGQRGDADEAPDLLDVREHAAERADDGRPRARDDHARACS